MVYKRHPRNRGSGHGEDTKLQAEDLLRWVVQCLYQEEAEPKGTLIQWWVLYLTGVKLSHYQLLHHLEATEGLYLEPLTSKRLAFRVVLKEPPPGFGGFALEEGTDMKNGAPSISAELKGEARRVLASGGWPKADELPFKYFVVASWLQDASPMMRSLTFGKVLQIVRWAAFDLILGHKDGFLVPYEQSDEYMRQLNASTKRPTGVAENEDWIKTWAQLKALLRDLIGHQPLLPGRTRPLLEAAKLKLLCRSLYQIELSETAFGHCSLTQLLRDPELANEFGLEQVEKSLHIFCLPEAEKCKEGPVECGRRPRTVGRTTYASC